jgi:hypothetical protein
MKILGDSSLALSCCEFRDILPFFSHIFLCREADKKLRRASFSL